MESWRTFTNPRFQVRFKYPFVTPQGSVVEFKEEQSSDFVRVHLVSRDSQEVYFELRRYDDLSPHEEYERHRANLERRFEAEGFAITGLTNQKIGALLVQQYAFQWNAKQRVAILIQLESATYRFIYDPISPFNLRMLSTVELITSSSSR